MLFNDESQSITVAVIVNFDESLRGARSSTLVPETMLATLIDTLAGAKCLWYALGAGIHQPQGRVTFVNYHCCVQSIRSIGGCRSQKCLSNIELSTFLLPSGCQLSRRYSNVKVDFVKLCNILERQFIGILDDHASLAALGQQLILVACSKGLQCRVTKCTLYTGLDNINWRLQSIAFKQQQIVNCSLHSNALLGHAAQLVLVLLIFLGWENDLIDTGVPEVDSFVDVRRTDPVQSWASLLNERLDSVHAAIL